MLETDAPYLTPHPHRGQRNEPAYVSLVCDKLAALYDVSTTQMAAESTALAQQFFGISVMQGSTLQDDHSPALGRAGQPRPMGRA
jgi:TatD DNase family protein